MNEYARERGKERERPEKKEKVYSNMIGGTAVSVLVDIHIYTYITDASMAKKRETHPWGLYVSLSRMLLSIPLECYSLPTCAMSVCLHTHTTF